MKITKFMEKNKIVRFIELGLFCVLCLLTIGLFIGGTCYINQKPGDITYTNTYEVVRNSDDEDYDESCTVCDVIYENKESDVSLIVSYSYEEYVELDEEDKINCYEYTNTKGDKFYFKDLNPSNSLIKQTARNYYLDNSNNVFSVATCLLILFLSLGVVLFFGTCFSLYEKIWFMSIMVLATIISILFPEESANGVSGIWIMLLYLLDTILNILCELLISKQSRWNFIVSVLVEVTEILICIVLMYRFATMATTLFFWLPIDIISFINWTKHKDKQEEELTIVRRLKGWQEVLILCGIALWTILVGWLLSGINIHTDLFGGNEKIKVFVDYMDACASAVGICNGVFILFRFREQWIAWYVEAILEAIINIVSGQYVLLVLKLGYITNTTYGYIKWTKYIKKNELVLNK